VTKNRVGLLARYARGEAYDLCLSRTPCGAANTYQQPVAPHCHTGTTERYAAHQNRTTTCTRAALDYVALGDSTAAGLGVPPSEC
jgi:hypothetical protein